MGGGPEVKEAVGGGDGMKACKGKKGEGEFEPVVGGRVESVESEESGDMAVGGLEGEKGEGARLAVEEVEEGGGGEGGTESLAHTLCGRDLAKGEVAKDLVECILR